MGRTPASRLGKNPPEPAGSSDDLTLLEVAILFDLLLVKCPCVATGAQIYFPITCILIFLESISKSFNTSVLISVRYNSYFDD
jgi:hypothetical protein